jgi:pyruvate dehydrogenase E2 component (dihydrolipoamide acetyltransferase)
VTPIVRKLASDNDIDLAAVKGTGVGGRIRKQDVVAAAEAKTAPAAPAAEAAPAAKPAADAPTPAPAHLRGTTQKAGRIRQITAKKTRESLQTTAQLTQTHEVDMSKIVALRARAKNEFAGREGVNLTYLPFIAGVVIDALKIHPNVNASYNEETKEISYYDAEHLGFAVDTEQGLLSPVIHNAGNLSLAGLARDSAHNFCGEYSVAGAFVSRTRAGAAPRACQNDAGAESLSRARPMVCPSARNWSGCPPQRKHASATSATRVAARLD